MNQEIEPQKVELSSKMWQFLRERPNHTSDAATARAIGIGGTTIRAWKSDQSRADRIAFRREYNRVIAHMEAAKDDFDPESYVKEHLVPVAVRRVEEIIRDPITSKTPDSRVRNVKDAAFKILEGSGYLHGHDANPTSITNIVNNFVQEGGQYQASWQKKGQTSDGHDVEG